MKVKWDSKYSVHVLELDLQHQHLIELTEKIEQASKEEAFEDSIHQILNDLMEYVMIHFHTEEAYLKSVGFEQFEMHQALHEGLAKDVNDRINEIINRKATALDLVKLHNFLISWVNSHILEEDQKYVDALKEMHDV